MSRPPYMLMSLPDRKVAILIAVRRSRNVPACLPVGNVSNRSKPSVVDGKLYSTCGDARCVGNRLRRMPSCEIIVERRVGVAVGVASLDAACEGVTQEKRKKKRRTPGDGIVADSMMLVGPVGESDPLLSVHEEANSGGPARTHNVTEMSR